MSRLTGQWRSRGVIRALSMAGLLSLMVLAAALAGCSSRETKGAEKLARESAKPKTFDSPAAAGAALIAAAQAGDRDALMAIFGPDGKEILYSGDAVKDKNTLELFVNKYKEMNRWSKSEAGSEILYIGADNLAFPIPLEKNASGQWAFNTAAGKDEVLARRIGDGELTAIGVLTEVAGAQQEYFNQAHQYAQKFVSSEGQHDGLYWPAAEGQRQSPLGPLGDVAQALGYSRSDKPQPFNGYYYHMLTQQGGAAKGGAKDYMANGKLTGGFAVVAYPAKYGDSGIMTFLVGTDEVVYQKDLGEKTAETAAAISEFNPSEGWTVVVAPEANPLPGTKTARKQVKP
jgi:Protein of unknown function (DUF2950)